MNYFKITISGETIKNYDYIRKYLDKFIEEIEEDGKTEIGIATFTPIDEDGDPLKLVVNWIKADEEETIKNYDYIRKYLDKTVTYSDRTDYKEERKEE